VYTALEYSKLKESQANLEKNKYKFVNCKKNPIKKLTASHSFNMLGRVLTWAALHALIIKKFSASVMVATIKLSWVDNSIILMTLKY